MPLALLTKSMRRPYTNTNNVAYEINNSRYEPVKSFRNEAYKAYETALTSPFKRSRHCAIVFDSEFNPISISVNYGVIHAEVAVISECSDIPEDAWILVVCGNMLGKMKLSKPCLKCYNHIKKSGIKKIIYSTGHMEFDVVYL
jgi:pyrimidine deaminase RibD-like protein